jgi:hypothetical protein
MMASELSLVGHSTGMETACPGRSPFQALTGAMNPGCRVPAKTKLQSAQEKGREN